MWYCPFYAACSPPCRQAGNRRAAGAAAGLRRWPIWCNLFVLRRRLRLTRIAGVLLNNYKRLRGDTVPSHSSEQIRNIALVGHAGAGKTTLAEGLLVAGGAIGAAGSVERGTTVSDYDPQEKTLHHSLDATVMCLEHDGLHVNLIDTPGYPEFIGRALGSLEAVETAAVVVNAANGVEPMTVRMMEQARDLGLCRMMIINRIDAAGVDFSALLAEIREAFGPECLPINLPADGASRVADCFFEHEDGNTDFSSVAEAHTQIVDQVVELDEDLMELYLEQGEELDPAQLHDTFEKALREGHLVPICFSSCETDVGVRQLLRVFEKLMPNPMEGNAPAFMKGEGDEAKPVEVKPDPSDHAIAHVFKVSIDPFAGKLGVFRVHQGTITPQSQLFIGDARKPFKVGHLFRLHGKDHKEIRQALPGDICAVAKIDDIHMDDVLHDSHDEDHFHLKPAVFPEPLLGVAVEPESRGQEQKLSDALHKMMAEDPCIKMEHNKTANETVLYGMGEFHLRMLLERLNERYNVQVATHPPSIAYRETVTGAAEGHHRHKKQTGGAGQFGEVFLRIEALPRGSGFQFDNKVVGGAIPSQFIPAVEKGVRQVLDEGAIAGFPVQDIKVTVYDGKHHAVDSKEIAFVTAGKKAFLDAIAKARPILLEPIVKVEMFAPSGSMGDIAGDLSSRRGRINGNTSLPGDRVSILGEVPLAEFRDYQTRLKSLTGGEGEFTMDFSHYEAVPPNVQQELISNYRHPAESD